MEPDRSLIMFVPEFPQLTACIVVFTVLSTLCILFVVLIHLQILGKLSHCGIKEMAWYMYARIHNYTTSCVQKYAASSKVTTTSVDNLDVY